MDRAFAFRVAIKCVGQFYFLHSNSMLNIERLCRFTMLLPTRTASCFRGAKATRHLHRFSQDTQSSPQGGWPAQYFKELNH
jgi:hypothetical protein